ncbi:MAG TPA: ADP-ribosylglycohydrolase family protein [Clostridia bacterium]|nr:ADP-ribosylglycohydrolase family protein [Clostridia bacterium]
MLGAIVGDIVGSRFEFNNHRSKDFELFTDRSFVTDDSIMTLAVGKAIMETARVLDREDPAFYPLLSKMAVKYMQGLGRPYPDSGFGGRFYDWIYRDDPQPYGSYGNGAAMRVSPVAFFANSMEEIVHLSHAVTAVSHNHPQGIKGAEATAVAIFLARQGASLAVIGRHIQDHYYDLNVSLDEIRPVYQFNETCQETVPQAIQAFLESKSFEDAIRNAISIGGDSDTIGAITGAMAQAYYGIDDEIREKALSYLDDRLLGLYHEWEAFMKKARRDNYG